MTLSEREKFERKRARMIASWKKYTLGTAKNKVATDFQQMVRAEAAADDPGLAPAIVGGIVSTRWRNIGECVCVTCGRIAWWKGDSIGGGVIETGHFIGSRGASIIFEPSNANPQCKHCNRHLGGNQSNYELWMQSVHGPDEPDRLRKLKHELKKFTKEELVDMRLLFRERLEAAELFINNYY